MVQVDGVVGFGQGPYMHAWRAVHVPAGLPVMVQLARAVPVLLTLRCVWVCAGWLP